MIDNNKDSTLCCGLHGALFSGDAVHRNFGFMLLGVLIMPISFILMYPMGRLALGGTPVCTAFAAAVLVLALGGKPFSSCSRKKTLLVRVLLIVAVCASAGVYFGGCNQVAHFRYELYGDAMLWDSVFLQMDSHLLGFLFPQGQLALFLDQNPIIGPTTLIGRIAAEILQIMYASYYFWGNGMAVYLLLQYYLAHHNNNNDTTMTKEQHWRRLMMFSTAWTGTYLFNFTLNLLFPAVSPRIYIADQYQNEISGLFFANTIRSALKGAAANSYSAFPSGHCGLSWLPAYMAHRFGFARYAKIAKFAAVLITSATIVLRYHYCVDMLFATVLFAFGVTVGNLYSAEVYQANVVGPSKRNINNKDLNLIF